MQIIKPQLATSLSNIVDPARDADVRFLFQPLAVFLQERIEMGDVGGEGDGDVELVRVWVGGRSCYRGRPESKDRPGSELEILLSAGTE